MSIPEHPLGPQTAQEDRRAKVAGGWQGCPDHTVTDKNGSMGNYPPASRSPVFLSMAYLQPESPYQSQPHVLETTKRYDRLVSLTEKGYPSRSTAHHRRDALDALLSQALVLDRDAKSISEGLTERTAAYIETHRGGSHGLADAGNQRRSFLDQSPLGYLPPSNGCIRQQVRQLFEKARVHGPQPSGNQREGRTS